MIKICRLLALYAIFVTAPVCAFAKEPNCTSPDAWPSGMAFTHLKNAGLLGDLAIDTSITRVRLIASERIGKDLFRQVHLVRFSIRIGEQLSAITVNVVSSQECSMSNVDVYLVSKQLGDYSDEKHKKSVR